MVWIFHLRHCCRTPTIFLKRWMDSCNTSNKTTIRKNEQTTFQWIHLYCVNVMNGAPPTAPIQLFQWPYALFIRLFVVRLFIYLYFHYTLCSHAYTHTLSLGEPYQFIRMWLWQFIMVYNTPWWKNKRVAYVWKILCDKWVCCVDEIEKSIWYLF